MKRYLLPALFSMFMAQGALADAFQISDIRVNGLQRVSAGSVFTSLPLNIGDEVDDQELVEADELLRRYDCGLLTTEDFAWADGLADWVPVEEAVQIHLRGQPAQQRARHVRCRGAALRAEQLRSTRLS